ncbi:PQQ-binding-like beta-propeller repeat protein [Halomontanus rarus]|uniref:outer membrane protein assembly factor BamB family protein n=1 Tax=Halomontanus rarus TaxID=3034020 RepID=UPI0023E7E967|nr:PQQ-binding-like beta-propeller repeat protein [Halovivax sp. TS33]
MRLQSRRGILTASAGVLSLCAGCVGNSEDESPNDTTDDSSTETTTDSNDAADTSSTEATDDWRSFRSGSTNDGFVDAAGPRSEPSPEWSADLSTPIRTAPSVDDGTVYVGVDATLHALEGGETNWTIDLEASVTGSPAVTDDLVVCPAGETLVVTDHSGGDVRRIDLADSTASFASDQAQSAPTYSSPAVVDGIAYVGTSAGDLVAVALAEGTVEWRVAPTEFEFQSRQPAPEPGLSSPAVTDELVVVGTDSGVVAVDATDGTREWDHATDWPVRASPAVVDGTVYVDGRVPLALEASSGTERWRSEDAFSSARSRRTAPFELLQQRSPAVGSSVAVADDLVVVNDGGRRLVALKAENGSARWETPLDERASFASRRRTTMSTRQVASPETSPTIAGDVALVASESGLVAVSLAEGDRLWRYAADSQLTSSPVVADGAILVGDDGGRLSSLEVEGSD